jgi:hypothetical protein
MSEEVLEFKNCLSAAKCYDLVAEDEIEMKVNGTMILKEQVPNGKIWLAHVSLHIEETNA